MNKTDRCDLEMASYALSAALNAAERAMWYSDDLAVDLHDSKAKTQTYFDMALTQTQANTC